VFAEHFSALSLIYLMFFKLYKLFLIAWLHNSNEFDVNGGVSGKNGTTNNGKLPILGFGVGIGCLEWGGG